MAKIICIDDDPDVIETLKTILTDSKHEVETAYNGTDGFEKAKTFKPDMIILDVMMTSETEGFHTAYKFRKDDDLKFKPILMLTSVNQVTGMKFDPDKDGEFLPVDEFIEKPISPDKLNQLVEKLLSLPKDKINVKGK